MDASRPGSSFRSAVLVGFPAFSSPLMRVAWPQGPVVHPLQQATPVRVYSWGHRILPGQGQSADTSIQASQSGVPSNCSSHLPPVLYPGRLPPGSF